MSAKVDGAEENMFSKVYSAGVIGIEGFEVVAECRNLSFRVLLILL